MRTKGKVKVSVGDAIKAVETHNVIGTTCGYSDKATDPNQLKQGGRESNIVHIADCWNAIEAMGGDAGVALMQWTQMRNALQRIVSAYAAGDAHVEIHDAGQILAKLPPQ